MPTKDSAQDHGFTSRQDWDAFFAQYNREIRALNTGTDDLLRGEAPLDQWATRYRVHAQRVRRAYLRTSQALDLHVNWFIEAPERWTPPVAGSLLDYLFRYASELEDKECAYAAATSLLERYTGLRDEVAVMKCRVVRALCLSYLDGVHLSREISGECLAARTVYVRRFHGLTPEEQRMGLSIYETLFDLCDTDFALHPAIPAAQMDRTARLYGEALDLARRVGAVLPPDGSLPPVPDFDHILAFAVLGLSPGDFTSARVQVLLEAAQAVVDEHTAVPPAYPHSLLGCRLCLEMARRLAGERTDGDVWSFIAEALPGGGQSEFPMPPHTVYSLYAAAETLIRDLPQPPKLYYSVLAYFLDYFSRLSFSSYHNYLSSTYIYRYIRRSLARLEGRTDLRSALLRLTVLRQPQTAVHSLMVGKLARVITDSALEHVPAFFSSLPGAETPELVRAHRGELLDFIETGALLHDVGKLLCPNIINTQYRPISSIGYRAVQFHTATGGELLEGLPPLAPFRDIALGHHRDFNGAGGYPADFDASASPLKPVIHIITLCDSLDAATDRLGRNYANPKDFDTVLDEFRSQSGVRYAPSLVELLDLDAPLRDRLRALLDQGRTETYYEVHQLLSDSAQ